MKKKIKKIILIFALVLILAISVITLRAQLSTVSINNVHQCREETVYYTEKEPIYEYVTYERLIYATEELYNSENESYYKRTYQTGAEKYEVYENVGTKEVQKSKKVCIEDTSYLTINTGFKSLPIDYSKFNFYCSNTENQIVCDSKDDGNGDGICQSGESCVIFDIQKDKIKLTHKNSNWPVTCFKREIRGIPFEVCIDPTVNIRDFLEVR